VTTVLVTRAASDSGTLCDALRQAGLVPVSVPLLERVGHVDAVRDALRRAHDGWVLTSAAAVRVLVAAGAHPTGWVAAVGPRTAGAARAQGWTVAVVPETATAAELVTALGHLDGSRVLYPRADLASSVVGDGLTAAGAVVDEVVAYSNTLPAGAGAALAAVWPPDVVTLLSGSAARRLADLRPAPWRPGPWVVVIGPSTERVAVAAGLPVHAVASEHTVAGVVAATLALGTPKRS
jgi:uroporphyrinogen-III synthase